LEIKKNRMAKIALASLLAMGAVLGIVALLSSQKCKVRELIWNQQIQSSANFGSIIVKDCE
jgi:hypothetical protein